MPTIVVGGKNRADKSSKDSKSKDKKDKQQKQQGGGEYDTTLQDLNIGWSDNEYNKYITNKETLLPDQKKLFDIVQDKFKIAKKVTPGEKKVINLLPLKTAIENFRNSTKPPVSVPALPSTVSTPVPAAAPGASVDPQTVQNLINKAKESINSIKLGTGKEAREEALNNAVTNFTDAVELVKKLGNNADSAKNALTEAQAAAEKAQAALAALQPINTSSLGGDRKLRKSKSKSKK